MADCCTNSLVAVQAFSPLDLNGAQVKDPDKKPIDKKDNVCLSKR